MFFENELQEPICVDTVEYEIQFACKGAFFLTFLVQMESELLAPIG